MELFEKENKKIEVSKAQNEHMLQQTIQQVTENTDMIYLARLNFYKDFDEFEDQNLQNMLKIERKKEQK